MTGARRIDVGRVFERLSWVADAHPIRGLVIDGRFRVGDRLGAGGMGEVFRADDLRLHRPVAIKVLAGRLAGTALIQRFQSEARTLAAIDHPGIVPVYDLGSLPDGRLYFAMKLVEGTTLGDLIAAGRDRKALMRLLAAACRVVERAHGQGILHRDLKPANIMVDVNEAVYVLDWGLATAMDRAEDPGGAERLFAPGLTSHGSALGTLGYMSPEQAAGDRRLLGPRADVFGLGAILYEILTGREPVRGTTPAECLESARKCEPVPPRELDGSVSADAEAVCLKALARDPRWRYSSAGALADELERLTAGRPVLARPPGPARRAAGFLRRHAVRGAALAVLATACIAAAATWREMRRSESKAKEGRKREALLERARIGLEQAESCLCSPAATHADVARLVEEAQRTLQEVRRRWPDSDGARFLEGTACEILGRWDRAEEAWRSALEADSGRGWVRFRLGRLLLFRTHAYLYLPTDDDPGLAAAFRRQALEAAEHLEGARSLDAGVDPELLKALAAAVRAYAGDQWAKCAQIASEATARIPDQKGVEDLHWLMGVAKENQDDSQGASAAYGRALAIRPCHLPALLDRGNLRMESGDRPGAFADLDAALRMYPDSAVAWGIRAAVRLQSADYKGAIEDSSRGLAIEPRMFHGYGIRAWAHLRSGDAKAALEDFDREIRANPDGCKGFRDRAICRRETGDVGSALADFAEAVKRHSTCPATHRELGMTLVDLGKWREAIQELCTSLEAGPNYTALLARGAAYEGLGDWASARRDYDEAIRLDPKGFHARQYRGILRDGRLDDASGAIEDFGEAIRLKPDDFASYYHRGGAWMKIGKPAEAVKDFEAALRFAPPENREECLARLKKAREALK